jgi:head-tail adaptor
MSFDSRLVHRLAIERSTAGAVDDQNMPAQTWSTLAEVAGLIQPKSARETAQLNQAGVVVSTHTIYLRPTDITEADRIRAITGPPGTYQLDGIRDAAGLGHHLEIDAQMVAA